ncbi:hypothetical protein ACFORG_08435 [Lutimaribacter marinistellae]|uniref:Uncharacterized protein n=1 Tax=Lutimaribacter marinistellae TaxID=1820329 RepID=A0ABV7TDY6_9RHOB
MNSIKAQAHLHHQYFLGLQLMVAVEKGRDVVGDWMFRLFRRQHEDKFLSSFEKLGLSDLPHAVACAKYHVLSNGVGGVRVEYMEENDRKAWVRFRYPRWMYDGPAICGIPVEASRGFLRGWYAQNGVSLKNPRLGYVCVSEDLTGQFGLCGYFQEYDHELLPEERLRFAPQEVPPSFDPSKQPAPPDDQWSDERLSKAARNYALEYVRNGLRELGHVIGADQAMDIGKRAARLTGLQQYRHLAQAMDCVDGAVPDVADFLQKAFAGMGDGVEMTLHDDGQQAKVTQTGLRVVRDIEGHDRASILACWIQLWLGAIASHRSFFDVGVEHNADGLVWKLSLREQASIQQT